jgi:protein involved in ribonucleotide reduction
VPKQVIRFLNDPQNRQLIRGVIGAGNTNFGDNYCMAGDIIAAKCRVPHLYRFELMGTPEDVSRSTKDWKSFGHDCRRHRSNQGGQHAVDTAQEAAACL